MTPATGRPWFEAAFGAHYPDLYAHRDHAEARRCLELLPRLAPLGPGPVLDLGCGAGRHLPLLAGQGLAPVGLDLSAPLLARARRGDADQPLVRADMRRIPLRADACTAVVSLFTAFGYFGDVAAHVPVAREVARVLRPGGHWFLDFLDSDRVAARRAAGPRTSERQLDALAVNETRRMADAPRRVVKTVALTPRAGREDRAAALGVGPAGLTYAEEVTLFTLAELDALAAAGGLHRVAAAGDYDGAPLVPGASERWILVYRRPEAGKDLS